MMSNVDPRYLRTCQIDRVADEDGVLLKRELGRIERVAPDEARDDRTAARTGRHGRLEKTTNKKDAGDRAGDPTATR